jgi:hypothetical protein
MRRDGESAARCCKIKIESPLQVDQVGGRVLLAMVVGVNVEDRIFSDADVTYVRCLRLMVSGQARWVCPATFTSTF